MNITFQNALNRVPQKVPPIWLMRQAGRYHSHYRKLREKYSFIELCKTPELAAEVALGPVDEFDFDVAILFSDILFPLEALGIGLEYTDGGPRLNLNLNSDNLLKLNSLDRAIDSLSFQKFAMQATRQLLPSHKSLIGFIGGPWTLYVYAVEGSHAGSLTNAKSTPTLFINFIEILYPLLRENIKLQIDGGAEVVMIFDTAAGECSPHFFKSIIQPVLTKLSHDFPGKLGYYSKTTQKSFFNRDFRELPWAGVGVDHRWSIADAFSLRSDGFIQGCFDQSLLFQDKNDFKITLDTYFSNITELSIDSRAGWVCGLGHGVLPRTPEDNVKYFVNHTREVFAK